MKKILTTKMVSSQEEIKKFFDNNAYDYREQHGHPDKLLQKRIQLIMNTGNISSGDTVLDIGCGNGHHLFAIAGKIKRGVGIDFSENMIRVAQKRWEISQFKDKLSFQIDESQKLSTVEDGSIDLAICIGSFEHMLNKEIVVKQFYRVLKKKGRLILLTPNGDFYWYKKLAPLLRIDTKHLYSDQFFTVKDLDKLFYNAGFRSISIDYWTFIPRGDMKPMLGILLQLFDALGRYLKISNFRGGILFSAIK